MASQANSFLVIFKKSKDYKASLDKPPTRKQGVFKAFDKALNTFIEKNRGKEGKEELNFNLGKMRRVLDLYKTKILPNQSLEEVRGFYDSILATEDPTTEGVLNNMMNRIMDMGSVPTKELEELGKKVMEEEQGVGAKEDKPTPKLRGAGAGAGAEPKEPVEPVEPKPDEPKPDEPKPVEPKPEEPLPPIPEETPAPIPAEPKTADDEEEEEKDDKADVKPEEVAPEKPKEVEGTSQQEPNTNIVETIKDDKSMLDPNINPPSKKLGKSLQDLSVEEINKDLDYFYKTFPDRLKKLKRTTSKNLRYLRRFYRRVLNLLRVEDKKEDKQIGIIIKGSDFIKDKLKEIILENSINGLTAKDLLINIEGKEDKDKADAGKYVFKTNPTSGKKYAQGEPVERLIPTQEEKRVEEVHSDHTPSSYKKKPNRIPTPKTMYRGPEVTARKMVQANPFLTARQPTIKLKTIY